MTTNRLRYEGIAKPFWANGKPLGEPLNHWVSDWFMTGSLWLVTGSSTKNQGLGWSPAAQLDGTEILILWLLLGIHDLWWKACHPPRFVEFSTCPEWCSHCCLRGPNKKHKEWPNFGGSLWRRKGQRIPRIPGHLGYQLDDEPNHDEKIEK